LNTPKKSPLRSPPLRDAGQSLREELDEVLYRKAMTWVLVALLGILMAGLEWLRWWLNSPPRPLIASGVGLLMVALAIWRFMRLIPRIRRLAGETTDLPVLSVTKHEGFVESLQYFRKRVFSRDTSDYKVVQRGEFAYSAIHLDEGAIALLGTHEAGLISPMYKVFRMKVPAEEVDPVFLLLVLKSQSLIERYKNLGKGSVKRRKSISFEKFASIRIPRPPSDAQKELAAKAYRLYTLQDQVAVAKRELDETLTGLLQKAGAAQPSR